MPLSALGYSPRVYRLEIAAELGSINQAVVLEQLHYWLERATKEHAGHKWVYKTYSEWGSELGISTKQARVALKSLRDLGLVVSINNPNSPMDQTLWWRTDEVVIDMLTRTIDGRKQTR